MKNKKIKISIIILIIALVLIAIAGAIYKPKYELNKAVEYLKYGKYKEAHSYIQSKNNEENKTIVKELITQSFCDRASSGIKKVGDIANECTSVIRKSKMNSIVDYTLDDNINIDVQALDTYIALEDEISKDMILDELSETYDLYFDIIKFARENFYDVLNHKNDDEFISNVSNLASNMTKISNDCFSIADNHKFNPKFIDLYEKIKKYIVN